MFELGLWREPTPIFTGRGHSARKKKPAGIPNSGTPADYYPNQKFD